MNTPFPSQTVSARLNKSEHERLIKIYREMYGEESERPFKEMLLDLLNRLDQSGATDTTEFEHKIFVLQNESTLKDEALEEAQRTISQLNQRIEEITRHTQEPGEVLPANAIVINPGPVTDEILSRMSEEASRRFRREISRADILIDLFTQTVERGPGDYLPLFFTADEIHKLKIKNAKSNE